MKSAEIKLIKGVKITEIKKIKDNISSIIEELTTQIKQEKEIRNISTCNIDEIKNLYPDIYNILKFNTKKTLEYYFKKLNSIPNLTDVLSINHFKFSDFFIEIIETDKAKLEFTVFFISEKMKLIDSLNNKILISLSPHKDSDLIPTFLIEMGDGLSFYDYKLNNHSY
ncbi:MAG: hypothetical protein M9897_07660 [Brumimicrobium sp.]|nr:hypothetical protein [Brumimicrobium sp.]